MPEKKHQVDQPSLCFLLANWYSGATVFSILLNNHRALSCNGELLPFWTQSPDSLMCSCGESLENCELYKANCGHFRINGTLDQTIFAPVPLFSKNLHVQRVFRSFRLAPVIERLSPLLRNYDSTIQRFVSAHLELFDNVKTFDGSSVYVDGTKSIRRVDLFARHTDRPIKVVFQIRDGRKFAASYKIAQQLPPEKLAEAANQWNDYIRMLDTLVQRHPRIEFLTVRHEDLCADKEGTIRNVCEFLGVDYDQDIFGFSNKPYHVLGNVMRHKFNGEIRESSDWRDRLTEGEYDKLTQLMDSNLRRFDYLT